VVCAPTAALADGLATALVARPDRVLGRLQGLGVSALIEDEQGRWWSTDGWQEAA
jgi:thiamine biosynthesis lipoprotein ApbE